MESIVVRPLTTGQVRVHQDMNRGRGVGLVRRARILRKGPMGEMRPIHAWLVEHPEGRILVDAGETHAAVDQSFAEFHVGREDELDRQLEAAGVAPGTVERVVLTHVHGDHVDGLVHVPQARVVASAKEVKVARSVASAMTRRFTKQPLPDGFAPEGLELDGPAIGAFARSRALTDDGRVVMVPTPGHTPGHVSVLVVQDDHHVLIGGDTAYDEAQLRDLHVDGVSPSGRTAKATMQRILDHARQHPTIYLPSHDPDSARRLRDAVTL